MPTLGIREGLPEGRVHEFKKKWHLRIVILSTLVEKNILSETY